MRFLHLFLIAVAIALAANSGATMAQNYLWLPTAEDPPGDWNDMANWSDAGGDFVPEGQVNETAQISSGGTAFVQDVIDNSGFSGDGTLGPGEITVTNGSVLEIRSGALMSTDIRGGSVTGAVLVNSGASLRFLGSGKLSAELLTIGGAGVFDYRVTSASSFGIAPATIAGAAQLGGVLQVDFGSGASYSPGNVVRLIDAASIMGDFAEINVTGNVLGSLGLGQEFALQRVAGGNGAIAQLAVEQRLILNVDRDTMEVSISNPASTPIAIDGYSVASAIGSIDDDNFTGLGAGWSTSPTSPNRVTQLRTSGTSSFANGTPTSIGSIFDPPAPTQIGVDLDDLQFTYTLQDNTELTGFVNYIGDKRENNIVLTIDEDGMAAIQNESTLTVDIEGYTITSVGGLLDSTGWNSLDEQNVEGGLWAASPISDQFRVTELMSDGTTTFTPMKGFTLGKLYDDTGAGSLEDLTFQFLIAGQASPVTGVVVFGDLPDLSPGTDGDFNGDGFVNAADYVHWRDQMGDTPSYNTWRSNFGDVAGSGFSAGAAVPEPSGIALCALIVLWPLACYVQRQNRK